MSEAPESVVRREPGAQGRAVVEAMSDDDLDASFREHARFDWLYFGRYDRLHAPVTMTVDEFEWCAEDVAFACGCRAEAAWIPGISSRLGLPRCARCCDRLGLPRGTGSPKNDDECRALLGLDRIETKESK